MKHTLSIVALAGWLVGCAGASTEQQSRDVISEALSSSVQLFSEREGGVRRAGSGVVVASDKSGRVFILTTAHLVLPPVEQTVRAVTPDGRQQYEAKILAVNSETDVAILEAQGAEGIPVSLKTQAHLGDLVWVVSFPWGGRVTVVNAVVSQLSEDQEQAGGMIEGAPRLIDASVAYGTSGGGVFDGESGALVGIVRGYRTAKLSFPKPLSTSVDLPVSGETTLVSMPEIICALKEAGLENRVTVAFGASDADAGKCRERGG